VIVRIVSKDRFIASTSNKKDTISQFKVSYV
jgi:hypothetical protein